MISIRLAQDSDFDSIKCLWKKERTNLSIPFTNEILGPIKEKRMFVLCLDNSVIGFCAYKFVKKSTAVELKHLCVNSDYRKNGYGKMLFQKINGVVPKQLPLVLSCRDGADNNKFYDKYSISYTKEERKTITVRKYILNREKLGVIQC